MVLFESLCAVSYSPSIVTISLSCISLEMNTDIGRESWFFHTPLHSAPPLGESLSEYCHPVWYGKTSMVGLTDGEKNFEDMYNRLHTIPACDGQTDGRTDRQTDTQTSCHGIVRAMHARHAVKITIFSQYPTLSGKWCKIEQKLLGKANRKPHPSFRMVPVWMILSVL